MDHVRQGGVPSSQHRPAPSPLARSCSTSVVRGGAADLAPAPPSPSSFPPSLSGPPPLPPRTALPHPSLLALRCPTRPPPRPPFTPRRHRPGLPPGSLSGEKRPHKGLACHGQSGGRAGRRGVRSPGVSMILAAPWTPRSGSQELHVHLLVGSRDIERNDSFVLTTWTQAALSWAPSRRDYRGYQGRATMSAMAQLVTGNVAASVASRQGSTRAVRAMAEVPTAGRQTAHADVRSKVRPPADAKIFVYRKKPAGDRASGSGGGVARRRTCCCSVTRARFCSC